MICLADFRFHIHDIISQITSKGSAFQRLSIPEWSWERRVAFSNDQVTVETFSVSSIERQFPFEGVIWWLVAGRNEGHHNYSDVLERIVQVCDLSERSQVWIWEGVFFEKVEFFARVSHTTRANQLTRKFLKIMVENYAF